MIGSVWGLLAVGAVLASGAMALLWIVQVRIRDASHVDVAWAILIACAALLYALLAEGDVAHRVLAAALASIWGWRLGLYLLLNRVLGKEEDGRYKELRAKWGERANRNFFWFFQFQAALVVFFSLPYATPPSCHRNPGDGGASAAKPVGLRRVPAYDERIRSASAKGARDG